MMKNVLRFIPVDRALVTGLVCMLMLQAGVAHAQEGGYHLDQYRAAETPGDGFAISRPDDLGHLRIGAHLHLDYAYNPLVYELELGESDTQQGAYVQHMLAANIAASIGFINRIVVFLGLPINLVMQGEDDFIGFNSALGADGTSIGDLYLGARVRIWGENDDIFSIGAQATVTFPTAEWADDSQNYAGEQNFTGHLEVMAEVRPGPVRITLNVGARFREGTDFGDMAGFSSGHELTYGLGLTWTVIEQLEILGEIYGASVFENFGDRESTPFEGLAGLRYYPGLGFVLGLAGGGGIVRGAGSPAARAVFTFGWARPPAEEPGDRDGDGLLDDVDECPDDPEDIDEFEDENGCPDPDNDADGVLDVDDNCPMEPEDQDQWEDEDGCPDPDNDSDGYLDADDGCPNEPEDRDEFEDEDGCPDPDNDQDQVLDTDDECPMEPEDRDTFEDDDGCPDPDNDQDTVLDPDDECPLAPGEPSANGCPVSVRVENAQIRILQQIQFETDRARLHRTAFPILQEVLAVLRANPQIRGVRVEGHTDSRNSEEYNQDLSQRRAQTVVDWLVENGIEQNRLTPRGYGESRPIDDNNTRRGRLNNRRVEFHITDPAPPSDGDAQTVEDAQ